MTPVSDRVMNGSAATFSPTCFIVTRARTPASDAPTAVSRATFSLTHHSAWTPSSAGGRLDDLGGRGPGVPADEADAGAPGALGDGFVAGEEEGSFHGAHSIADWRSRTRAREHRPMARRAGAAHTPADGRPMGRRRSDPRHAALLRGRLRVVFFLVLSIGLRDLRRGGRRSYPPRSASAPASSPSRSRAGGATSSPTRSSSSTGCSWAAPSPSPAARTAPSSSPSPRSRSFSSCPRRAPTGPTCSSPLSPSSSFSERPTPRSEATARRASSSSSPWSRRARRPRRCCAARRAARPS